MKELIKHIEAINAKTQKWIDEDPTNRWAGMITTDPEHWKEYGITTPAQYDRYMLEQAVYETHKSAYGVKGRHYAFDNMTHQEIAVKLGISVGTSKSNLAKARRNLRKILIEKKTDNV